MTSKSTDLANQASPLGERRSRLRRAADRQAPRQARFLARSVRIMAEPKSAEERLADLLVVVAGLVGADRAAYLCDRGEPRVAVVVRDREAPDDAMALGRWFAEQSLSGCDDPLQLPPVVLVASHLPAPRDRSAARRPHYVLRPLPGGCNAGLAFAFRSARGAATALPRLTPVMAGHAGAALESLAQAISDERELATLRRVDGERRRFTSTVAHELRTPLAALSGYLDLVVESKVTDASVLEEFLARSHELVNGMSSLVGDLLELSRLESGQLELSIAPFSGTDAGLATLENLMPLARAREIALEAALPTRLRSVLADRRRVEQVLVNLVGNAIKFCPGGTTVVLRLDFDGPVAVYAVRDHGKGIAPEERDSLFEPFHRGNGSARIVGTGLGLSIARDLTRRMGGDVDVASIPGMGSSFVVGLPATKEAEPAAIALALEHARHREEIELAHGNHRSRPESEAQDASRVVTGALLRSRNGGRRRARRSNGEAAVAD